MSNTFSQVRLLLLVFTLISTSIAQNTLGLLRGGVEASPGYTLFAPINSTSTYLINNDGLPVHEWSSHYTPSLSVYLLEDGSLLRSANISSDTSAFKGGLEKYTWDGQLVWQLYLENQHHDIEPLPNGNVLVISTDRRSIEESIAQGRDPASIGSQGINSVSILEISQSSPATGEIVWAWHAWDHLIQDFDISKANYGDVELHPELIDINFGGSGGEAWLHTNSVDYNAQLDQIVVSNRSSDDLWIIDHSTSTEEAASHQGGNSNRGGDLLYRWGNPQSYRAGSVADRQLFGQHDVQWIDEGSPGAGNLLIFNNGLNPPERGYSSVIEIVPPVDSLGNYALSNAGVFGPQTPIWEYVSDSSYQFVAGRYGGTQRLVNGNTLICSPLDGRFFEVTPEQQTVWIYVNPIYDLGAYTQGDIPTKNEVFRSTRYPEDYPGLKDRVLIPGKPLELYPSGTQAIEPGPRELTLLGSFPNPFNPTANISYTLLEQADVRLTVFDMQGREVKTLQHGKFSAGSYESTWDGSDRYGVNVSAGVYFVRLQAGQSLKTHKMIYLP